MKIRYDTFPTPAGEFSVAVDETGAVIATAFGGLKALSGRSNAVLASKPERDAIALAKAREQVREYFAGKRTRFALRVDPAGTPFQRRVWDALLEIPFGATRTYGAIAASLGNAGASRAVGRANALNPVSLFIPCHRVIGGDGSLTGYAFGEKIKERLLRHEGAL